jgi:hypothetical protein
MRISKRRYDTELVCLAVAARMIEHEARTVTICHWSRVSQQRVRELYRRFDGKQGRARAIRHGGPPPRKAATFLRKDVRDEASALAAICALLSLVPMRPSREWTQAAGHPGALLCRTYEMYQSLVPDSQMSLDHLSLLVTALSEGKELRLGHCTACEAAMIFDPLGAELRLCSECINASRNAEPAVRAPGPPDTPVQHSLF